MSRIQRKHSSKLKLKVALEAYRGIKTVAELSQEYSILPAQIYAWKKMLEDSDEAVFGSSQKDASTHQKELEKLHAVIGKLKVENDFLEKALSR